MSQILLQSAMRAHQAGNLAEAARLYGEILRTDPRHFPALYSMGVLYYEAAQFEQAQRIIGEAIRVNPRSPEAIFTRGCALQQLNRAAEALVCFEQTLALRPNFADAQSSRGAVLMALNRNEQALESFDAALALDDSNAGAWSNRGCILQKLGRYEEALACFDRAIAGAPGLANAFVNRGSALAALKRYEDAAADFDRALAIDPDLAYARGNLMLYRMHACDWRNYVRDRAKISAALRAGKRVIYPFVNVALSTSMADQLQAARIWVANEAPASAAPLWRGERYRHDKIRLAYVSADFRAHATSHLMSGVFENHDRNRFEIIGVSYGPDDRSEMRARIAGACDRFIDTTARSDAEIASLIRQMEIDIAVDLKGYTQHNRCGIFALKPAPIQASYLGYASTMGAEYIDYILSDRTVVPESDERYYQEKVVCLPHSYYPTSYTSGIGPVSSRGAAGLPESGFVFCCFNNNFKITPGMFDIWMRLLREVSGSVLWLLEDNSNAMRNLRREAESRGVAADRLVFAARADTAAHLARHANADLFLDTQPYGAHTTASDALWAGLPVLTVLGPTLVARVAASLLCAIGLPELIADSPESYETMALTLARNPAALAAIKAKLARNRHTHPLFDTPRLTRDLETAYQTMWERQQRGEPPSRFAVGRSGALISS
jgi:predicted O-linked N-acetylglucosamine transferase (SPINDLY family)